VVGRVLIQTLMWTMPDEMLLVLTEHGTGVCSASLILRMVASLTLGLVWL
jgi:hypothetical protein